MTSRCGRRAASPHSQFEGALVPTSPRRRARLTSAIPPRNSGENAASTAGETPSLSRPAAVNATWSAVGGGGALVVALATGAAPSHARAADALFTRTSAYDA